MPKTTDVDNQALIRNYLPDNDALLVQPQCVVPEHYPCYPEIKALIMLVESKTQFD
jgi:hypothetical protein